MLNLRHHTREIDLQAIRGNVRLIRSAVPEKTRLMAVVKADAYGHGAVQVAKAALEAGASFLAVASVEEGLQLRAAGFTAPILVLGLVNELSAEKAAFSELTLSVCTPEGIAACEHAAEKAGRMLYVHLCLDTGMGRIGARDEAELRAVLDALDEAWMVHLTGAFTHFADADGDDMTFTLEQLERFRALTALLPDKLLLHCANSAAIHRLMPEAAFGMVRMGISLYGYPPVACDLPLQPCMRWTTEITHVKEILPGDTVSYGRTVEAETPLRVATVACGYGDGYHRAASGKAEVLIRGKRARILGRICMDQMMADVTGIPGVCPGDTVTLLGRDGGECITAEDIARWAGTISYEVLLAGTGRVHRVWTGEEA